VGPEGCFHGHGEKLLGKTGVAVTQASQVSVLKATWAQFIPGDAISRLEEGVWWSNRMLAYRLSKSKVGHEKMGGQWGGALGVAQVTFSY